MSDEKKDASKVCSTCGKVENPVCSNSFHLPAYQSALQSPADNEAKWKQAHLDQALHILALDKALRTLRNEVRGTLRAHELAIRYDSGNSNWKCLEMALDSADEALAATTRPVTSEGDK